MSTREVAELLGVPEDAVRRLRQRRILKPLKGFRNPYRFGLAQVKAYLEGER
jgi:excisionase family DNA binding protein